MSLENMKLTKLIILLHTDFVEGFLLEGLMDQLQVSQSLKTIGGVVNTKKNLSLMTSNKKDREN